ncbi:hypothetical protein LCGC14_2892910, partial [marine sediment metagenome]
MASGIYNRFKANLMNKEVDLEADTIKVALYDNSHSFTAADTDYTTSNELASGSGYTTGGNTLASKAVTEAATTKWVAADRNWTAATFTAYHAVIYDTSVSNDLIASIDFGGAKAVVAG